MKQLIALALIALSFSAAANNEYCESLHGLAAKIMSVRQNEASMPELMKIVGDNAVAAEIVREAYKQQRYSSDEYQKKATDQFANEVYMTCLEATK